MKRLITALCFLALSFPALGQTGSSQSIPSLTSEINTSGADNNTGNITPHSFRQMLLDIINSNGLAVFNVGTYGAKCDASTDDTTAIQNAINAAQSASGANGSAVIFPSGNCIISSTVTVSSGTVHLVGAGRDSTTISVNSTTADGVDFNGTTFDSSIRAMRISKKASAGTATAGAAIGVSNGVGLIGIYDVRVGNGMYNAIAISNSTYASGTARIEYVDVEQPVNDGIYVHCDSQVWIADSAMFASGGAGTGAGIHIDCSGAFYLSGVTSGGFTTGMKINSVSTANQNVIQDGLIVNSEIDSSQNGGMIIDSTGGGTISDLLISNSRIGVSGVGLAGGASGGDGVLINGSATSNVSFTGCSVYANRTNGFNIVNGNNILVNGCQVYSNSAGSSLFDGIHISGGADIKIIGNRSTNSLQNPPWSGAGTQQQGISTTAAATGVIQIVDNDVSGNVSGGIFNASASGNVFVKNNTGGASGTCNDSVNSGATQLTQTCAIITTTTQLTPIEAVSSSVGGSTYQGLIWNNATSNNTQSQLELATGTAFAFAQFNVTDGSSLKSSWVNGAGLTGGILIDAHAGAGGSISLLPASGQPVTIGLAGTNTGAIQLNGTTSGSATITTPATGGSIQWPSSLVTAATPTAGASQIGIGQTTIAAGSGTCPTGTVGGQTVQGCWQINVAGTTRNIPFF